MTATAPGAGLPFAAVLRRLYLARAVFAVVWAAVLLATRPGTGLFLAVLLAVYPLVDAAAVLRQLRSERREPDGPRAAEQVNVAMSVLVAVLLGWASTRSVAAALGVWGAWAVGSGVAQLVAAVRRRRSGGQVPQVVSGAISVLAGASFLAQAAGGADSILGVGGYAFLGGVLFLVSAVRLTRLLRSGTTVASV